MRSSPKPSDATWRCLAKAVARLLGNDEVYGEVKPKDKDDLVQRLRAEGQRVAAQRLAS